MIKIRRASPKDIPWIVQQAEEFGKFYGTKTSPFGGYSHATKFFEDHIENHLVLVAEEADNLLGFISGFVTAHIYNPSIVHLAESFWWVPENFRGSRAGAMLLDAFQAWGKEHADWITLSLEAHSPINDSALLKRGFKLQERSYLMEID